MFLHRSFVFWCLRFFFMLLYSFCLFFYFYPIFSTTSLVFPYAIHPFDICYQYPTFWHYFKFLFLILSFYCSFLYSKPFSSFLVSKIPFSQDVPSSENTYQNRLRLLVGLDTITKEQRFLPESSLYQNILITGTIGSGKTSSSIYPFANQLIRYYSFSIQNKLGVLCLDVKGNLANQIAIYASQHNRRSRSYYYKSILWSDL